MPLPVIAGVVRAAVRGQMPSGQPWVNVVHFRYAGGASAPGATEIALLHPKFLRFYSGTAYTGGLAHLGGCRANTTLVDITYTPLDGASVSIVYTVNAVGTSSGTQSLPSEVAPVLTLRTGHRGRRYRGRIYLPAVAANALTTDGLIDIGTGNWGDNRVKQWQGMQTDILSNQWVPVVASYGKGSVNGVPQYWTAFATDVVTPTMDSKFDVQRRRK